jgi:hypothetical protein
MRAWALMRLYLVRQRELHRFRQGPSGLPQVAVEISKRRVFQDQVKQAASKAERASPRRHPV